jgi:hypothetical protein
MGYYDDWIASNPGKGGLLASAEFVLKKLDALSVPSHNHDDRYYTESEVDTKLSSKANTSDLANASVDHARYTETLHVPGVAWVSGKSEGGGVRLYQVDSPNGNATADNIRVNYANSAGSVSMPMPFIRTNYNIVFSQTVGLGNSRGYFNFTVSAGVNIKITVINNVIGLIRYGNYDTGDSWVIDVDRGMGPHTIFDWTNNNSQNTSGTICL